MRMITEINRIASSLTTEDWYSNAGPLWSPAISFVDVEVYSYI